MFCFVNCDPRGSVYTMGDRFV